MFYDIFAELCANRGVKPGAAAEACGINRSNVSLWKSKGFTPRGEALQAIAKYFEVSTDYLLGKTDIKKSPSAENREVTDEDIKFALFGGGDVTDAEYEEVKRYAKYVREQKAKNDK